MAAVVYSKEDGNVEDDKKPVLAKTAADLQRIRLEKLMKNPEKPVYIPDGPKEKKPKEPMEFVRNVWGSSAGAGSGEFHVYRGIRRREYARQKFLTEKTAKDSQDVAYHNKVLINEQLADERTAKKRAKRQKKKNKQKAKKPKIKDDNSEESDESIDEGAIKSDVGEAANDSGDQR